MYSNFSKAIRSWVLIIQLNNLNLTLLFLWDGLYSISLLHIYTVSSPSSLCPGRLTCRDRPMRSHYKRLEGAKVHLPPWEVVSGWLPPALKITSTSTGPFPRPCKLLSVFLLNPTNCSHPLSLKGPELSLVIFLHSAHTLVNNSLTKSSLDYSNVSSFPWLIAPNLIFILTSKQHLCQFLLSVKLY